MQCPHKGRPVLWPAFHRAPWALLPTCSLASVPTAKHPPDLSAFPSSLSLEAMFTLLPQVTALGTPRVHTHARPLKGHRPSLWKLYLLQEARTITWGWPAMCMADENTLLFQRDLDTPRLWCQRGSYVVHC